MYDTKESKAAIETLDTTLKTTELYVYANCSNLNAYNDAVQVDITAADMNDAAVKKKGAVAEKNIFLFYQFCPL